MADIVYIYAEKPYLNITNQCPCACTFCIRQNGDGLGTADTLWHRHDPSTEEVMAALHDFDFTGYDEVVFCGYGEPTMAMDTLMTAARYLKNEKGLRIRLNTNGLSDLIHGEPTAKKLSEVVDIVSISLNAATPATYNEVTRPTYGERAFDAMLQFAADCKKYIPTVKFTVVDVISEAEIAQCRRIADEMGIQLRVRHYIKD